MALSSLSVVTNANRLRGFTPRPISDAAHAPATDPVVEVGSDEEKEEDMHETAKTVDPVCGMTVDPATAAASVEHEGRTVYFCSQQCAKTFQADPAQYAKAV